MVVRNNKQPAIRKTTRNEEPFQSFVKEINATIKYYREQNEQEAKADNTVLEADSKVLDAFIAKYKKCPEKEEKARREEIKKIQNEMHNVYNRKTIRKQNRKRDILVVVAGTVTGTAIGVVIGYRIRNINIARNWTNKQIV